MRRGRAKQAEWREEAVCAVSDWLSAKNERPQGQRALACVQRGDVSEVVEDKGGEDRTWPLSLVPATNAFRLLVTIVTGFRASLAA